MKKYDIASTIMQQLGGYRFTMMTGAKNFVTLDPTDEFDGGITFMIPRSNNVRAVRVYLLKDDTYRMEFVRIFKHDHTVIKSFEGVYNDNLQNLFTEVTGLYTKL